MPNTREKLIELICSVEYGNGSLIGNNFQKGFIEKIADHLIANGVTFDEQVASSSKQVASNEWISVKDRLPDLELAEAKANEADLYPCLVVIKHARAKGGRFVSKCWYNGYDFVDTDSCPWTFETTHWMPLPQPPKGE